MLVTAQGSTWLHTLPTPHPPAARRFEQWSPEVASGALLDPARPTVCLCHHGVRSGQVAQWLVGTAGFSDVRNVMGGIDAYSRGVDPAVPQY